MNAQYLIEVLQGTTNNDNNIRKAAEETLNNVGIWCSFITRRLPILPDSFHACYRSLMKTTFLLLLRWYFI